MLRTVNLDALNSATKYPSIKTFHVLGERGRLTETVTEFPGPVLGYEKIDGTNSRVIVLPNGKWLIGQREQLLTACDDIVYNPSLGIVDTLRPIAVGPANGVINSLSDSGYGNLIRVYYFEVYGGRVSKASKQYTSTQAYDARLFDVAHIDLDVLDWKLEEISSWRENGGQSFCTVDEMLTIAIEEGLGIVPPVAILAAGEMPTTLAGTYEMMKAHLPYTRAQIDPEEAETGLKGVPEGIVFRSPDRSVIAKARFEDYERTLKGLKK